MSSTTLVDALGLCFGTAVLALGCLRWLRVAQREHYLAGTTVRFARRWWLATGVNRALAVAGAAGALASLWYPPAGFAALVVAGGAPIGLKLRGTTSPLAWTPRLRRLAGTSALLAGLVVGLVAVAGLHAAFSAVTICALGAPVLIDAALTLLKPVEARLLRPYVDRASQRLRAVAPRVVAITGSYGKTTTKGYVAHLVAGSRSVVATPASFNNTAGLARAINEHLATGTQVFVAEMGTYGAGEIAAMCAWTRPEVAVITAIGPVHLERMGSLERIAEAKAEILDKASVAILNVDHPLLAQLAQKVEEEGKTVWRCSSQEPRGDVTVTAEAGGLRVRAAHVGAEMDLLVPAGPEVEPGNVACAVAVALALGVPTGTVAGRLGSLPGAPHRRSAQRGANGARIIDDTYNANPAGAKAALALLGVIGDPAGKRVVVTPGMVELGRLQDRENANFAAGTGTVATELVVVGRTNARSLMAGAKAAGVPVHRARDRKAAVGWVSAHLRAVDAVLYENDLPDHYP
jgi:UDP-N-acetylmuramoyl-tripeptide--D-alanyl-D-alanine ligase